jgi:hypothetical protein
VACAPHAALYPDGLATNTHVHWVSKHSTQIMMALEPPKRSRPQTWVMLSSNSSQPTCMRIGQVLPGTDCCSHWAAMRGVQGSGDRGVVALTAPQRVQPATHKVSVAVGACAAALMQGR